MGLVDWTKVDPKPEGNGSSNKDIYLRLEAGKKYRIRPVGKPMEVNRYYVPDAATGKTRSAITADPKTCIIRQKYPNIQPKLRYAVNVIDRADGKIKVLEAPPSIFRSMRQWAEATGKDPGGSEGADFSISVEIPAGADKRRTTYPTAALVPTPFTEDELAMIRSSGHKLSKIYEPTPRDKIESILFGPAQAKGQQKATSSAAPASSSGSDDDFGF